MSINYRVISDGNNKSILAIYSLAGLLLAYSIFPEIGITHDSRFYLEAGENLMSRGFQQTTFKYWPPLYPITIFLLSNKLWVISFFNISCWLISTYVILKEVRRILAEDSLQNHFMVAGVVFSTPIFMVHNFVWSEPPFLACVFAFILSLRSDHQRIWIAQILLAVAIVGFRHIGVTVITGSYLAVLIHRGFSAKDLSWVLVSASFFLLWQWHVSDLIGHTERVYYFRSLDLLHNYQLISIGLARWFLPFDLAAFSLSIPVIWVALITITIRVYKSIFFTSWGIISLLTFFLILVSPNLLFDDVERYLSISHPLIVICIFSIMNKVRSIPFYLSNFLLLLFTFYSVLRTVKNAILWH